MRRSLAWLVAVAVANPAWPQPEPLAGPASGPAPVPDSDKGGGSGLRWMLPPVALSGSASYDYRLSTVPDEPRTLQRLLSVTMNAHSYIYQPWLATVTGTLGLTKATSTGGQDSGDSRDSFVTGGLRFGIFPRSRFPLEVRYETSDSRTDSSLAGGIDYRAQTFALVQRYRPANGAYTLSATYERRSQDSLQIGEDTQETLLADFSTQWKSNALSANASRSLNRRRSTGEETDFLSVVGRHSYSLGSTLTVESSANWAQVDNHLSSENTSLTVSQWSSVAMWRPEGTALTVNGTARGFTTSGQGGSSNQSSTAIGIGFSYEASPNVRLSGSAMGTQFNSERRLSLNGSVGVMYQGQTSKWGDTNHDWYGSAALTSTQSSGNDEFSLSLQVGQTLSRAWRLTSASTLAASLNQTVAVAQSSGDPVPGSGQSATARSLSQSAALTWTASGVDRSAYARLSLSDARQFDGERGQFQLLNFQVSGAYETSRFSGWSGDLTLQKVLQNSRTFDPFTPHLFGESRLSTYTASGELTWRHQLLFGVPRLRFTSRLRLSRDGQRQSSTLLSIADRETLSWENKVDYSIGRIETGLSWRLSQADGVRRQFLMWRLQRNFGG